MIDPDGKRISLFVNGDIPYVRVGSSKSLAHDDDEATAILEVLNNDRGKEEVAAAALLRKQFQVRLTVKKEAVKSMLDYLILILMKYLMKKFPA